MIWLGGAMFFYEASELLMINVAVDLLTSSEFGER